MGVGGDQHVSNVTGPDTAPNHDQRFERLVDQYQESVLRTCYLYLCDKTLAEDATQETFLRVYRTIDSFRGESSEVPVRTLMTRYEGTSCIQSGPIRNTSCSQRQR